jgi:hypothetical protein
MSNSLIKANHNQTKKRTIENKADESLQCKFAVELQAEPMEFPFGQLTESFGTNT